MTKVVIPHRDPFKSGATEHVDAIIKSLREQNLKDVIIANPVENIYAKKDGENLPVDLTAQIEKIKTQYGNAEYVVVTGDYGGDKALSDINVSETFKRVLGKNSKVILSSYTAETETLVEAFRKGSVDFMAVPDYAVKPSVLESAVAKLVMKDSPGKLIMMTAVPHNLTVADLTVKHKEWDIAAENGKVKPLPKPDKTRNMVGIIIPGDVEDAKGNPKLFTESDAEKLADEIGNRIKSELAPIVMISNGPRTGKYNKAFVAEPNFNANNPAFQNQQRMDSVDKNPVAKAFIERLKQYVGEENIILGCIEKGKVPPQGFLAFYDVLNQQAAIGGKATIYIDGVSTTMMAQAANVINPKVQLIACDTPAKNNTHIAGSDALFAKGHIDQLSLEDNGYVLKANEKQRLNAVKFDDAALITDKISHILQVGEVAKIRSFC